MLTRIRSIWLAGGGALALTLTLSGVVAAATVLTTIVAPAPVTPTVVVDTTATWEDLDGNGIDDDCQTDVVADPVAAASAEAGADADGDGTISVSEAAHTDRTGGKNCNHGGYVSWVAHGSCAAAPAVTVAVDATLASSEPVDQSADTDADADGAEATDCAEIVAAVEPRETPAECVVEPVTPVEAVVVALDPAKNAHGKKVAEVANSDAVGGKNCNHGGAVSEAAKKDHDAAKEARNAAKVARDAAKDARQAAREAAREAKKHGKNGG